MILAMPDANVKNTPTPCGLFSIHLHPAGISFFSFQMNSMVCKCNA